jgi:hypothetical protein
MDLTQLVQDVLDGNESGLIALAALNEQAAIIKNCIDQVKPVALDEAAQYAEKTFNFKDLQIEKRAGGRMYSFKHLEAWNLAKAEVKAIEDRAKVALKASESGLNTADDNGEIPELPIVTYRADSLIIKRLEA